MSPPIRSSPVAVNCYFFFFFFDEMRGSITIDFRGQEFSKTLCPHLPLLETVKKFTRPFPTRAFSNCCLSGGTAPPTPGTQTQARGRCPWPLPLLHPVGILTWAKVSRDLHVVLPVKDSFFRNDSRFGRTHTTGHGRSHRNLYCRSEGVGAAQQGPHGPPPLSLVLLEPCGLRLD